MIPQWETPKTCKFDSHDVDLSNIGYCRACYGKTKRKQETELEEIAPMSDVVNHPPHYNQGGMETIDVIKAKLTSEGFKGYLIGNIVKYITRFEFKGRPKEDLAKAQWYLEKLVDEFE